MKSHLKTEFVLVLNQFSEEDEPASPSHNDIGDANNNAKLETDDDTTKDASSFLSAVCNIKNKMKFFINNTETSVKQENEDSYGIKQEVEEFDETVVYDENQIKLEPIQVLEADLWVCAVCDLQCKTKAGYVTHLRTHNKPLKYVCAECGLGTSSKCILIKHMHTHRRFMCSICRSKCYLEASLHHHFKKHDLNPNGDTLDKNENNSVCKICDAFFTREENLIFHMHTSHIDQKCNMIVSDQASLVDHIKYIQCKDCNGYVHETENHKCRMPCTYTCEYCNAQFALKNGLTTHRRVHFEKPDVPDDPFEITVPLHVCHICNRNYKTKFCLRDHLKNIHGPKVVRTCEICNKSYMTKKAFAEHNLKVHPKTKKYKCDVCGKPFVARHLVTRHMLKHTGEKKYQCEDCGKFFQMIYTLKLHKKIHLDDKSFQCYDCGKKFVTKGNLQIHVKTHLRKAFD